MPFQYKEIDRGKPIPTNPDKQCGTCTACCSSIPVSEIGLLPYTRCHYLRAPFDPKIGCSIYADRPISCRNWSCVWLSSELPDELRPDRCGIVIDPVADLIRVNGVDTPCVHIWVMRGHEEAYLHWPVSEALMLLLKQGNPILWQLPFGPGEVSLAQVLVLREGKIVASPLFPSVKQVSGFSNDRERLARAQQLLRGTPETRE
jgi:hypothetical protein